MNRHDRRAARARAPDIIETAIGRCVMASENTVTCFVCGNEAKAWPWPDGPALQGYGIARITCHCGQCNGEPYDMPICERCHSSGDVDKAVIRKLYKAPDLKITQGGHYNSIESLKQNLKTPTRGTKH
jgi:hypothetical protein